MRRKRPAQGWGTILNISPPTNPLLQPNQNMTIRAILRAWPHSWNSLPVHLVPPMVPPLSPELPDCLKAEIFMGSEWVGETLRFPGHETSYACLHGSDPSLVNPSTRTHCSSINTAPAPSFFSFFHLLFFLFLLISFSVAWGQRQRRDSGQVKLPFKLVMKHFKGISSLLDSQQDAWQRWGVTNILLIYSTDFLTAVYVHPLLE